MSNPSTSRLFFGAGALALLAAACGGSGVEQGGSAPGAAGAPHSERPLVPGTEVIVEAPPGVVAELGDLEKELRSVEHLTADGFLERYAVPFAPGPSYDPAGAAGIDRIAASSIGLDADERAKLEQNGFVVTDRRVFPTFVYGYQTLYMEDLPLFVSADSILHAVHRSYDSILEAIETSVLVPDLEKMLDSMRAALASGAASDLGAAAEADADLYLTVAASLLAGAPRPPALSADPAEVGALYGAAKAASGWKTTELFGARRDVDFSQFTPRGHYTGSEQLKRYFRAMMWLGRIDLRLLETLPDHSQVFHRRQLEGALALRALMGSATRDRWARIDRTVGAFVGEPDNMTLPELDALLADLGAADAKAVAAIPDASIAQAVVDGGYGTQRIASHIMIDGLGAGTMPLSSTFLLFGQRYVVDSHVFSNVVYDRVAGGSVYRMMPDPLDAAFAAFGNDQAGLLLEDEIREYGYAPDLASMRILVDAHPDAYWRENLYNLWLGAIRALSPAPDVAAPSSAGLPEVAGTDAWGRRLLGAQLASWAELRHDTLLYAKQSYTGGATCEFPDAYVDPYPGVFARVATLASTGKDLVASLDLGDAQWLASSVGGYFDDLGAAATTLREMAEHERSGAPFTAEQMDFINDAVVVTSGCGDPDGAAGWYARLFYRPQLSIEADPTIADVHTQPTDEVGSPVGRVLHVATGSPRVMIVTVDTCTGPRAYAGLVSSYFERITDGFQRLDDETWASELRAATPPDPTWMQGVVVR